MLELHTRVEHLLIPLRRGYADRASAAVLMRRLYDVINDLKQHRMYLIFEYLDGDMYRLMQVKRTSFLACS